MPPASNILHRCEVPLPWNFCLTQESRNYWNDFLTGYSVKSVRQRFDCNKAKPRKAHLSCGKSSLHFHTHTINTCTNLHAHATYILYIYTVCVHWFNRELNTTQYSNSAKYESHSWWLLINCWHKQQLSDCAFALWRKHNSENYNTHGKGIGNGLSKHQSHEIIQKSTSQNGWGKNSNPTRHGSRQMLKLKYIDTRTRTHMREQTNTRTHACPDSIQKQLFIKPLWLSAKRTDVLHHREYPLRVAQYRDT